MSRSLIYISCIRQGNLLCVRLQVSVGKCCKYSSGN